MTVYVKTDGASVSLVVNGLSANLEKMAPDLVMEGAQIATTAIRRVVMDEPWKNPKGGLARSWHETYIGGSGFDAVAASTSDLVYARIQDEGGTIRPKTVKNLAIPLRPMAIGKWPRHWAKGKLQFIPSKKSGVTGILATVSKKGNVAPQYVLKREVTIPPHHYINTAADEAEPEIAELGQKAIDDASGAAIRKGKK